jgi:membrane protein YdbS with pleckstrin-like domain
MNCPKCHFTVEADSRFCKYCGASLAAGAAAATAAPMTPSNRGPASPSGASSAGADPLSAAAKETKPGDLHRDPAMEKDVWQGRPSWRAYCGTWLLWFVAAITALILVYRSTEATGSGQTLRTITWLVAFALGVALFVRQFLVIYGQHFRLTTQRLFMNRGILSRVTDQLELVRVEDVRLRQGIVDRLVNTGRVEIISSDQTDQDLTLESIAEPAQVAEHIRRNVRGARGKGSLFVENV